MANFDGLEQSQYCVREGELDGKSVVYDIYHGLPHAVCQIGLYRTGSRTFTNHTKLLECSTCKPPHSKLSRPETYLCVTNRQVCVQRGRAMPRSIRN